MNTCTPNNRLQSLPPETPTHTCDLPTGPLHTFLPTNPQPLVQRRASTSPSPSRLHAPLIQHQVTSPPTHQDHGSHGLHNSRIFPSAHEPPSSFFREGAHRCTLFSSYELLCPRHLAGKRAHTHNIRPMLPPPGILFHSAGKTAEKDDKNRKIPGNTEKKDRCKNRHRYHR